MLHSCCDEEKTVKVERVALVPVNAGEQKCEPGHFWGAGVRASYLIHYIISGKGVFYCGTNKYELKKGQAFVIFPYTIIKYVADERDPWHYAWVTFSGEEAKEFFSYLGVSVLNPVLSGTDGNGLLSLIRQMPSSPPSVYTEKLRFTSLLYELLAVTSDKKRERENEKSENGYLNQAIDYIKGHFSEDITVEEIASFVGISRKYLFAIFKNSLGVSPKEYVIDYRIEKAKKFLKNMEIPVGSVAYSVGYPDQLAFSKIFKKKTGLSPTQYKSGLYHTES